MVAFISFVVRVVFPSFFSGLFPLFFDVQKIKFSSFLCFTYVLANLKSMKTNFTGNRANAAGGAISSSSSSLEVICLCPFSLLFSFFTFHFFIDIYYSICF